MSPNSNSGGGGDSRAGRSHGFPSAHNDDRHIQNIIDHTDAMFSAPPAQRTPQFTYGGIWMGDRNNAGPGYFTNPFAGDDVMSGYPQLDDFGMCCFDSPANLPESVSLINVFVSVTRLAGSGTAFSSSSRARLR